MADFSCVQSHQRLDDRPGDPAVRLPDWGRPITLRRNAASAIPVELQSGHQN